MYKIIFLSMANEDPIQEHNFNLLDESFETRDDAIKFVKDILVRDDVVGFIDGDPDIEADHDFEMEEYEDGNDYTIEHSVIYKPYRELVYLNKYKIVEVK